MQTVAVVGCALVGAALALALRPVVIRYAVANEPAAAPPPLGVLEVATAIVLAALAYRFGWSLELLAYSGIGGFGVSLAVIDLVARKLPNILLIAASAVLGIALGVDATLNSHGGNLARAAMAMAVALAVHGVLYALGAIAGGDLKLAGILGAGLGWTSWEAAWLGLAAGWLLGGVVVGAARIGRKRSVSRDIPLGPFLLAGALLLLLYFGPSTAAR
ncbi:prepilin peptidase [Amycolatopsis rubida]|uniref:Prepilin peptidase n=1 Tax=Amycolatopsis rubida TaxID=112413 RepID=A0ABX0BKM9_9PSEU|nr:MULTISPECIES: prepilin peptidase [Amycolatopsis]MYW90500.1 prepilin peptidase [Amycolatopsis rubida]MYW95132.1 prepilin peptidase [Amycolatopsis rubida]NEC55479.1 prepilin peptidase [Amycolatopsis rubida]NEC60120.1 prepilin peptidase [Amycolatopsis rubida]OAP25006.1 Type IV leader peptidase family protein [Amycolatopsis sp. M39]